MTDIVVSVAPSEGEQQNKHMHHVRANTTQHRETYTKQNTNTHTASTQWPSKQNNDQETRQRESDNQDSQQLNAETNTVHP